MGKTRYKRLREVLDRIKAERGSPISEGEFNTIILTEIASDSRYLKPNMILLSELKMISKEKDGIHIN